MANFQIIGVSQLNDAKLKNGVILDVRTKMEHDEKRLRLNHVHIPLDQLNADDFIEEYGLDKNASIYILCRSGKRACNAALKFDFENCPNVYVIDGGITACENFGYAVDGNVHRDNTPRISMERQVRIAAGALVAIGALLGFFVDKLFMIIPLFTGCGLIFAGITDLCSMSLLLAKAPWNNKR